MNIAVYNRNFLSKSDCPIARDSCIQYIKSTFGNDVNIDIYEDIGFPEMSTSQFAQMNHKIETMYYNKLVIYNIVNVLETSLNSINYLKSLENFNCAVHSIQVPFSTDNELGKKFLSMMQALYNAENEDRSATISRNKFNNAKKGSWNGGQIPYGFKYVSNKTFSTESSTDSSLLVPIKYEIDFVIEMYEEYLSAKSLSQLHKAMLAKGCLGKKGKPIQKSTVQSILLNPIYVKYDSKVRDYLLEKGYSVTNAEAGKGVFLYNSSSGAESIAATGNHDGVISSELWLKVQAKLKTLARKK